MITNARTQCLVAAIPFGSRDPAMVGVDSLPINREKFDNEDLQNRLDSGGWDWHRSN